MGTTRVFRTHAQFHAVQEPVFAGCTELSRSGGVHRWLAGEDAMIHITGAATTVQSIPVARGSIVLCESCNGGWTIAVPVPSESFEGEYADDLREPVFRGRRTGPKGTRA